MFVIEKSQLLNIALNGAFSRRSKFNGMRHYLKTEAKHSEAHAPCARAPNAFSCYMVVLVITGSTRIFRACPRIHFEPGQHDIYLIITNIQ